MTIAGSVEADETVADARARPRHRDVPDVREGALGQHEQQIVGAVEVGAFQRTRVARGQSGLMGQDRDDVVVVPHGNSLHVELPDPAESSCARIGFACRWRRS